MLELVNSAQRKPRARSPSIGLIVQRTLPIDELHVISSDAKANIKAIASDTHQLQFIKQHPFKLEIL